MWKRTLLVFLVSLSVANTVLDKPKESKRKTNECPLLKLVGKPCMVKKGQQVSLNCSIMGKSETPQNYSLYLGERHLKSEIARGKSKTFNLNISEARDLGPYKCNVQVSKCSTVKYSAEFSFIFTDPVATPVLNVDVIQTKNAQYVVTLRCISSQGSLPISYTFFENNVTVSTVPMDIREPAEINITKNTRTEGTYTCKAKNRLPNHSKYSQPVLTVTGEGGCPLCLQLLLPALVLVLIVIALILLCWQLPKHKARKAMRDNVPKDNGVMTMDVTEYATIHNDKADKESTSRLEARQYASTARDGTDHSQEIHYATPIFQKVAPGKHEACSDGKTEHVYSQLN
ncbi:allergin-1 [Tenrec ecaudatus]|uniref:allergin-1 n=1 Tax=Tenrec ecaudatus TaxID=94439 RepID=UPI003F5949D1